MGKRYDSGVAHASSEIANLTPLHFPLSKKCHPGRSEAEHRDLFINPR
jgi:hypothetical protein